MSHRASPLVFAPLLLVTACFAPSGASEHAGPLVRVHASKDLMCPQSEIRLVRGFGGKYEAYGCGRKSEYVTGCEGLQCTVEKGDGAIPWRDKPDQSGLPR